MMLRTFRTVTSGGVGIRLDWLLWATLLLGGTGAAFARDAGTLAGDHASPSPEAVIAPLRHASAWYREARIVMRLVRGTSDTNVGRGEAQTAQRALQRAFDTARARAALLAYEDESGRPGAPPGGQLSGRRGTLRARIEQDERALAQLRTRARTATGATRLTLERDLAAAGDQLELDRVQLDFVTRLEQFDVAVPAEEADLPHQIQALQDTVPELSSPSAVPAVVTASPNTASPPGAWALIYRLLALQRSRRSVVELTRATNAMVQSVDVELEATRQTIRPMVARLRALARDPAASGRTLAAGQQEFHDLIERGKLLGAVLLPLREEAALLHRYAADLTGWTSAVDRDIGQVLRGLALELVGVAGALAVILAGSLLWRLAAIRYVTNAYHRRLLLVARQAVVVIAITLVLVFHFANELTALVAALGFAAAGIAFALQNVILAVAGYFSIVAPNGMRVGDRVSLQGPFGYVHGEVTEIGLVRTRLRELAGEPLQPTGRIVVYPNSVMFTGSFFKHPAPEVRGR